MTGLAPLKAVLPPILVAAVVVAARSISVPGLEYRLAWSSFDNSAFYAYRFADGRLFPGDAWGQFAREAYPFFSVVHLVPALLLRFAHVDPVPVIAVVVFLQDLLLGLGIYALSQEFLGRAAVSLLATFIGLGARVMLWNLANYGYLGSWLSYPGDAFLPFALFALVLLIRRRVAWALLLAGALSLIHVAQALAFAVLVALFLLFTRREQDPRSLARWGSGGAILLALGLLPALYVSRVHIHTPLSTDEWWSAVGLNQHIVPWSSWWGWTWCLPFLQWAALGMLALRERNRINASARPALAASWAATFGLSLAAALFIALRQPALMQLGLFRISTLFDLAILPLVAAYLARKMTTGLLWEAGLAAGTALALGFLARPPLWLLLSGLLLADLAGGHLVIWTVRLSAQARAVLSAASIALFLAVAVAIGLAYWVPAAPGLIRLSAWSARLLGGAVPAAAAGWWLSLVALAVSLPWLLARTGVRNAFSVVPVLVTLALAKPFMDEARSLGTTQRSGIYQAWKATQDWAREQTPREAAFIGFPPGDYPQEWRTFAQRRLVDLAYRGYSVYMRDRALKAADDLSMALLGLHLDEPKTRLQWSIEAQQSYRGLTDADFERIATQTGAQFAVIQKPRALGFAVAYENEYFAVYDLAQSRYREEIYRVPLRNGDFEGPAPEGRPAGWSATNAVLSVSHDSAAGGQAARVLFDRPGEVGWLYTGTGGLLTPPVEDALHAAPGSRYRIRSQMRGAHCPDVEMFAIAFDREGTAKQVSLDQQRYLDQRYIADPHLYVPQVVFFDPPPETVTFRFAVRYFYYRPPHPPCELEVDQVEITRHVFVPLTP